MISHMFTFFVSIFFIFNNIDARSWDLAVTIGQDVHFFLANQTIVGSIKNQNAGELLGIAYDEISHKMFVSDLNNRNGGIYYQDLHSNATEMNALLQNVINSRISTMTYDPLSNSLIWIDTRKKGIYKLDVNTSKVSTPELILNVSNENPLSISMDSCNRKLYWINADYNNSSISSINIDGSNRTIIIKENLFEPVALTVDHTSGKLYWIDDEEGIFFKIERSNLDGSDREIFVHFKNQQPYHIAVDKERVYYIDWADNAIWYVSKDIKPGDIPEMWYSFYLINRQSDLKNLITRDNIGAIDCLSLVSSLKKASIDYNYLNNSTLLSNDDKYNTLVASDEEINNNQIEICLNGGSYIKINGTCQCRQGFNGRYCEKSLCDNYCLNGVCLINSNNEPQCKCYNKYDGIRCERDMCSGFCLNSNQCYIRNGKPACKCKNSHGLRCELPNLDNVCMVYCNKQLLASNSVNESLCRCPKTNSTQECIYNYDSWMNTLIPIFSVIIFILLIIIIILSYFINKLRRRPRVKKRFLVSKTGITPLTSRPSLPSDSCEIMIENCCNMNICETPCFEPKGRKIEKKVLIESMEGNNS